MKNFAIGAALCLAALSAGCGSINSEPPDMQTMHESRPLGGAKELNVELKYDVGNLEISKVADENLFSFDLQYDRRHYDPSFHFDEGDRASMRLEMNGHPGFGPGSRRDESDLTVRLTDKVPLNLEVTTGVAESHLEMSSLQVRRLHLRGGVGSTNVTFDKETAEPMQSLEVESGVGELVIHGLGNTHVEHVDLKGGVGRTELDFTGELGKTNSNATIKVGIGSVRLIVPRDADVDIDGQGSFLSNVSAPSFEHHDRTYTHHGDGGAHIHIRVESGIGGVEVELI
jgi:N-terminal domain of toast_rack, DUF2154